LRNKGINREVFALSLTIPPTLALPSIMICVPGFIAFVLVYPTVLQTLQMPEKHYFKIE
jgi:hypothetical protein